MFGDHRLAQRDGGLAGSLLLTYEDSGKRYVTSFRHWRRLNVNDCLNNFNCFFSDSEGRAGQEVVGEDKTKHPANFQNEKKNLMFAADQFRLFRRDPRYHNIFVWKK